jgi:predicted AAA+ superfamily ATPase
MVELKRDALADFEKWFSAPGRKPLLLRGARQVGKSTLVRKYAAQKNLRLYEINLEKNRALKNAFDSLSVKKILQELEFIFASGKISAKNSLLFIDEIQAIPSAIQSLRYFYEEYSDLPVVAAGSLLEVVLSKEEFSMPVGRISTLYLGPLTFKEFVENMGDLDLVALLSTFAVRGDFPESAHRRLIELFRVFCLVGGMPEAVARYASERDLSQTQRVIRELCETYHDDFMKYRNKLSLDLLQDLYQKIPSYLGQKIKISTLAEGVKSIEVKNALGWLADAQLIALATHSSCSGVPLQATQDEKISKPYFLDVGLVSFLTGIHSLRYEDVFTTQFINSGKIAEQFCAQHLLRISGSESRPYLHYWLREGKSDNAEVDFVVQYRSSIIPIEVKAGKSGTLKSLQEFSRERNPPLAVRFDTNLPSIQKLAHRNKHREEVSYTLISLPLYCVGELRRVLENELGV